jgi:hypothetical protein
MAAVRLTDMRDITSSSHRMHKVLWFEKCSTGYRNLTVADEILTSGLADVAVVCKSSLCHPNPTRVVAAFPFAKGVK